MCGGLVVAAARDRGAWVRYHLGRLAGYLGLGALAGLLGEAVLGGEAYVGVSWVLSVALGAGFLALGLRLWQGRPLHLFRLPEAFWARLGRLGPGAAGLGSAFLPCGWLHVFVLGAVATRSPIRGGLYLFLFWLGTLPALSLAPTLTRKILGPATRRAPRLSAVILILIGLGSLGFKMIPAQVEHCHAGAEETEDAP
jgi:sulfite exporter TauE/SafE